jgi:non-canonical purine NTP pyrophosphatase (RdgB/HAM1 family)
MKKLDSLTFITGNAHKAQSIEKHLDFPIEHQKLDLVEIQSLDLREVITFKAKEAYNQIHKPVLVEDTSVVFLALGRLPGTFIKWFWEELGNEGLCRILDSYTDRTVEVTNALGMYDGKELLVFTETVRGTIANEPKGENGYGWNLIFIPEEFEKTWAELTEEERSPFSARTKVVKQFAEYLNKI